MKSNTWSVPPEKEPGAEGVLMGEEKGDEDVAALQTEDQDEYDVEEPVLDADKPLNNKPDNVAIGTSAVPAASTVSEPVTITALLLPTDLEQELADYNGDDDNEGEFEADKQAVLSQDWGTKRKIHRQDFLPVLVCVIKSWDVLSVLAAVLDAGELSDCREIKARWSTGEGSSASRRHLHFWNVLVLFFFQFTPGVK